MKRVTADWAEERHLRAWAWAERNWLAFVHEVDDEDVRQLLCLINNNGVGAGTWRQRRDRGRGEGPRCPWRSGG